MSESSRRVLVTEAALAAWMTGGVDGLVGYAGPTVEWQPLGVETPMRGPELLEWVRKREAAGVKSSMGKPRFEEFADCVLVSTSVREYGGRGFDESTQTLVYEFEGGTLVRVRAFSSPEGAKLAARASLWLRQDAGEAVSRRTAGA